MATECCCCGGCCGCGGFVFVFVSVSVTVSVTGTVTVIVIVIVIGTVAVVVTVVVLVLVVVFGAVLSCVCMITTHDDAITLTVEPPVVCSSKTPVASCPCAFFYAPADLVLQALEVSMILSARAFHRFCLTFRFFQSGHLAACVLGVQLCPSFFCSASRAHAKDMSVPLHSASSLSMHEMSSASSLSDGM